MYLVDVWNMSYEDYVQHLIKKYGAATCNYFDENGKVIASRTWSDGLECHHIDEDKIPNLSDDNAWKKYPQYQTADRLVYCNRIEHLILHAKIAKMNDKKNNLRGSISYFRGGPELLIRRLNDAYTETPNDYDWNSRVHFRVRKWLPLYVQVLKRIELDMKELGYSDADIDSLLFSCSYDIPDPVIDCFNKNNLIDKMVV